MPFRTFAGFYPTKQFHTHTQQHTRNIQTIGGRDELDKQKIDVGESI